MGSRTMYDGLNTDAAAIGRQAKAGDVVGGYGDGRYAWSDTDWAHIAPGVVRVLIVVFSTTNDGVILDCEPGNATPAQSVDWVLMRRAAGVDPTVYMSVSNWATVRAAFQARGVREPHYWVAAYDNVQVIPAGAVGKQYADNLLLGKPWDESVVADYWPGIDPPHPHTIHQEDDMNTSSDQDGEAGLSWPTGSRHVVQATYDPRKGNPALRVVLNLPTGPWADPAPWTLSGGRGVYELPTDKVAACSGVVLEAAGQYPKYYVTAV